MSPQSIFYYYNKERAKDRAERFEISIKKNRKRKGYQLLFSNRLVLYNTDITKGLQLSKNDWKRF